jgi:hypothetical protein
MAAVLACGPGAVLSHFSAGHHWHMCGSYGPIEVLRQSGGCRPKGHRRVRLHQTRRLHAYEVTIERGIPVATMERVLLDLAGRTDAKRLERIFVQAYKSGAISWLRLARIIKRRRGCKGVGRLRLIAQEVDPQVLETKSVPEVDFFVLCREVNLPAPSVNVLVEGHLVDFLWPEQKAIVETDSWSHHGDRTTFESDHRRDVDLIAAGYDVHRTTARCSNATPNPSSTTFAALSRPELHQLLHPAEVEVDAVRKGVPQCASPLAWAGGRDSSAREVISSWPWAAASRTSVASWAERA